MSCLISDNSISVLYAKRDFFEQIWNKVEQTDSNADCRLHYYLLCPVSQKIEHDCTNTKEVIWRIFFTEGLLIKDIRNVFTHFFWHPLAYVCTFSCQCVGIFFRNYDPYPHPQNCGHPLWTVSRPEISLPPNLYIEWVKSGLWLLIDYSHVIFFFCLLSAYRIYLHLKTIIQTCWLFLQVFSNFIADYSKQK